MSVYSATQVYTWLHKERLQLEGVPLSCTQEAGDAFYVPLGWAHAVFNTKATISVAVEFQAMLEGGHIVHESVGEGLDGPRPKIVGALREMYMQ